MSAVPAAKSDAFKFITQLLGNMGCIYPCSAGVHMLQA